MQQEMLCLQCIYFHGQDLSTTPCLIVWMELTLGIHQQGGYRPSSSMGGLPITLLNVSLFVLSFYTLMVIHHISTFTHLNLRDDNILLYFLPLLSSHSTQPLDVKPLKSAWGKACNSYCATNPGFQVTKHEFAQVFREAWLSSTRMSTIVNGF